MDSLPVLLLIASFSFVVCQRPPYAGKHPIGYPEVETPSDPEAESIDLPFDSLPLEARGDRELVARLIKLPVDKQPFWLLNWEALEWNRQNPQTYPIRENPFLQNPIPNDY
ncbi:PREDICTED: uncharacterized protein LOC106105068 [Papilio polytes]|uniref:uncharacterized protein LOC106105068 n=1 Tax=Papilio polytes TaxID=76194 RepID=UPI0006761B8D|nr:PREDICTED: uncharacterized protein LOC106105068 [Papilio polytes]